MKEINYVKKYVVYPSVLTPDEDDPSILNIKFPNVSGALTYKRGFKDAMLNASETLALTLYDKPNLPEPSDIEDIRKKIFFFASRIHRCRFGRSR